MSCTHYLKPARAGIVAAMFFFCLTIPAPICADFRVTHGEETVHTRCYWIQHSTLHLCEVGEPLALSEVGAIEEGEMTALENELHRDALHRFFTHLAWLGDRESEITVLDDALSRGLLKLDELLGQKEKKKEINELKKKLLGDAEVIRQQVVWMKKTWEDLRIPERRLVKVYELKSLQVLTWLQSLQEIEIFLETLDPTFRAYALEHGRQTVQFRSLFKESVLHSGGEPVE